MWLWSWKADEREYGFTVLDCPNRLDQILVRAGMSPSASEATRLCKQGSVRIRPGDVGVSIFSDDEQGSAQDKFASYLAWQCIREPRFPLPLGKLYQLRIGHSPGVRLIPRDGRDGWDRYKSTQEVMFPLPGQGLRSWTALLAGDGVYIPWKAYWLDWLEYKYGTFKTWYQSHLGRTGPAA